jgi:MYXO-CTERM domain-containing protein
VKILAFTLPLTIASVLWASAAGAATLKVGPGARYAGIGDAMVDVKPGDVVEVLGDQTYIGTVTFRPENSGTAEQPVTVRGILVNGKRPRLRGVGPGEWDEMVVLLNANHFVFESFEVDGDGDEDSSCIVNKADDVVLRDLVVHDCLLQGGLVGNDFDSGSLTLEYSDFYHNGSGETSHQIYMTTDEAAYPGSVFRMQFCYVHDGYGGNNVKSRSERNEIYYNWIGGAMYHELDLIGPVSGDEGLAREDSDVVGNMLVKTSEWRIARIGGDGSGNTAGRYRFVNNTMVLSASSTTAIGLQESVESLEMYNNAIYGPESGFKVYDINEPSGPTTTFSGSNNWILDKTSGLPSTWTTTVSGASPGWVDTSNYDYRPGKDSPLIDQGTTESVASGSMAVPSSLALPAYMPPQRRLLAVGSAEARSVEGTVDIGAFEQNARAPGAPVEIAEDDSDSSGCGCRVARESGDAAGWLAMGSMAALVLARRRRQRR